jgi:naphthoate synthase
MHVETAVGMVAACGATQWLPLVIGDRRAREMLMTCDPVSADKALAWGLVNEVAPYVDLDRAVESLCTKLIDKFPDCTRYTKQQLNFWKTQAWDSTIERARSWLALHFAGPEAAEAMSALGEQREINYRAIRTLARQNGSHESRAALPPAIGGADAGVCSRCGGEGMPESYEYCGFCGTRIHRSSRHPDRKA